MARAKKMNGAQGIAIYKKNYAPTARRSLTYPFKPLSDQDLALAIGMVATGESLTAICDHFQAHLMCIWGALNRDPVTYASAREIRAQEHAFAIEQVVRDVISGVIEPEQGRVVLPACQWLAERLDGKRWGQTRAPEDTAEQARNALAAVGVDALRERLRMIAAAAGVAGMLPRPEIDVTPDAQAIEPSGKG